jgi:hypothetical protein
LRERSHSPIQQKQVHVTQSTKVVHSFSLYEQHREQRDQREHNEYSKAQNERQRQVDLFQMSQGIRDRIIASYRMEIESHKVNERDFSMIKAHIEDLRRRKEALELSVTSF